MLQRVEQAPHRLLAGLGRPHRRDDVQRVARPSLKFAKKAVRLGAKLNLVDIDECGRVRLTPALQAERNRLTEQEGYAEVAEGELADLILRRLEAGS